VSVYNTGSLGLVSVTNDMCLGHESSGIVARLGSNVAAKAAKAEEAAAALANGDGSMDAAKAVVGKRALKLGDKVTMEPGVTCRMCTDCRGGRYQVGGSSHSACCRS